MSLEITSSGRVAPGPAGPVQIDTLCAVQCVLGDRSLLDTARSDGPQNVSYFRQQVPGGPGGGSALSAATHETQSDVRLFRCDCLVLGPEWEPFPWDAAVFVGEDGFVRWGRDLGWCSEEEGQFAS